MYVILPRIIEITNSPRSEERFQQSKVIESYSDAISNLGGDTFSSVRFEQCRLKSGCILSR